MGKDKMESARDEDGTRPAPQPVEEEASLALQQHRLTLKFRSREAEGEFAALQAASRWRVLSLIAVFDCLMFVVRAAAKLAVAQQPVGRGMLAQMGNMALLYSLIALLNRRTRRLGSQAAKQEEALLCCLIAGTISLLLLSLRPGNAGDYVYAALFLTCTSAVLKLRWCVGTVALVVPVLIAAVTNLRLSMPLDATSCTADGIDGACAAAFAPPVARLGSIEFVAAGPLPVEALVHVLVAWAVGALMAFVSDSNRRESFVAHKLALSAAAKELGEVQARVLIERELAAAQQQAAGRALVVAREKAANEAKSEFMSLMCHEVRTPLNGCLASAEMLLDTQLDEEQRELAKTIRVSGSILLSTVSNFLDFFKIEAGKQLDIVRSSLDLGGLVTDVHCIIEAMVGQERGVALLPPDLEGAPATVLGDPARICGILLNLYTNAAKYTKRGSIGLRVRVVGPNYRPDPTVALRFCAAGEGPPLGGPPASRASRSASASMPDSAPDASTCSTPNDVLAAPAGVRQSATRNSAAAATTGKLSAPSRCGSGGAAAAIASSPRTLYQQNPVSERTSRDAQLLRATSSSGSSAAAGAAALLSRQEAAAGVPHAIMSSVTEVDGWSSVHSQPDPNFVLRHTVGSSGSVAGVASASPCASASSSEEWEEEPPRFLCFEVLDTGVGVSRAALESLFQDYVQGTDSEMRLPRPKGGTGLGLSICCKQVAVLGGAIGALSKPACGSVFWFTMPLVLPEHDSSSSESQEEDGEEEEASAAAEAAQAAANAAAAAAAAVAAVTPAQAAGRAAARRSMEASHAAAEAVAAAHCKAGSEGLPRGIPSSPLRLPGMPHGSTSSRKSSFDSGNPSKRGSGTSCGASRGASRRHSMEMETRLSSMWSAHPKGQRVRSGTSLAEMGEEEVWVGIGGGISSGGSGGTSSSGNSGSGNSGSGSGNYKSRNALSWENSLQPPSFTAAEMLQAMPLQHASGAAAAAAGSGGQHHKRLSHRRTAAPGSSTAATAGTTRGAHQQPSAGSSSAGSGVGGGSATSAPAHRQPNTSSHSLQGLSVLLAEDNLINQTVAKRVLTSLGCLCRVASNGREAVMAVEAAAAGGCQFDIILMDMCMPVLGGVEATQEIRQLGCQVPIVAMTANVSERDRVECIAAGMDGYLSKPVLKEQLTVAIREATQGEGRRA